MKSSIKKSRTKARKSTTKKSIAKAGKRKLDFKYGQVKIGHPSLAHHRGKKKIKGEESAGNC
ncbi:homogentisate phytyltransferase 1, chloroplastic-like protein [Corchorus olitorius]|uniref:Homogentisate phytyltransferase 1, chloroplastic-like protein n=1 Tax=Corchorus olitorius TaxID=93759 RepID=A0A1R3IAH4_9ROSI|nr:homogentisate phytyltransferase 1, chloroplastic-like protein [Corchorus olitorius]